MISAETLKIIAEMSFGAIISFSFLWLLIRKIPESDSAWQRTVRGENDKWRIENSEWRKQVTGVSERWSEVSCSIAEENRKEMERHIEELRTAREMNQRNTERVLAMLEKTINDK